MSENANYRGKRSGAAAKSEISDYEGKRRLERRMPTGIFHEPFSAYEDLDVTKVERDGTAFEVKKGKHEALIEAAYSTELQGRDFSIPKVKKKKNKLVLSLLGIVVIVGAVFAGFSLFSTDPPPPPPAPNTLGPVFAETYPDRAPITAFETVTPVDAGFSSSEGSSLTTEAYITLPSDSPCEVKSVGDYCLAGTIELPTSSGRVFYTSDVGSTSLLKSVYEVSELAKPTNVLVASAVVDLSGVPTRFLVLMDGLQGDGWLVEVPLDQSSDQTRSLANDLTHTP